MGLINNNRDVKVPTATGPAIRTIHVDSDGVSINVYNEISSVIKDVEVNVNSYIVPVGKSFLLKRVEFSGGNIAEFSITIDGSIEMKKNTWWTNFNGSFQFDNYPVGESSVILIRVLHKSEEIADFNCTIQGRLI